MTTARDRQRARLANKHPPRIYPAHWIGFWLAMVFTGWLIHPIVVPDRCTPHTWQHCR